MANGGLIGPHNPIVPNDTSGVFNMYEYQEANLYGNWPVTLQYVGSTVSNTAAFPLSSDVSGVQEGDLLVFVQTSTRDAATVTGVTPVNPITLDTATDIVDSQTNDAGFRTRCMVSYKICEGVVDTLVAFDGMNGSTDCKEIHVFRASKPIRVASHNYDGSVDSRAAEGGISLLTTPATKEVTDYVNSRAVISMLHIGQSGSSSGTPVPDLQDVNKVTVDAQPGSYFHMNSGTNTIRNWTSWYLITQKDEEYIHHYTGGLGTQGMKKLFLLNIILHS